MTPKPQPPADLWEQMDSLNEELDINIVTHGFTVEEYSERYGITRSAAETRVRKLFESNRIHRVGKKASKSGRFVTAYDVVGKSK